jgi:hypothetical protein
VNGATNGYSTNSGDYTGLLNQSVAFTLNQTQKTVSVSITNNTTPESNETFGFVVRRSCWMGIEWLKQIFERKLVFKEGRRTTMLDGKSSRRDFIKTTAYTVPVILTLKAMPAFAQVGSPGGGGGGTNGRGGRNGGGGGNGGTGGNGGGGTTNGGTNTGGLNAS